VDKTNTPVGWIDSWIKIKDDEILEYERCSTGKNVRRAVLFIFRTSFPGRIFLAAFERKTVSPWKDLLTSANFPTYMKILMYFKEKQL
jgi:hypothetical protein